MCLNLLFSSVEEAASFCLCFGINDFNDKQDAVYLIGMQTDATKTSLLP